MTPFSFYSSNGFAGLASDGLDNNLEQSPTFVTAGTEQTSEMATLADAAGETSFFSNPTMFQQQNTMESSNVEMSASTLEPAAHLPDLTFQSTPPGSPTPSDSSNDTDLEDFRFIDTTGLSFDDVTDAIDAEDDVMEFTSDRLRLRRMERYDEMIALSMTYRDVLVRIRPQWDEDQKDKMSMMFAEMVQEVDETPTAVADLSNMFEGLMRE